MLLFMILAAMKLDNDKKWYIIKKWQNFTSLNSVCREIAKKVEIESVIYAYVCSYVRSAAVPWMWAEMPSRPST